MRTVSFALLLALGCTALACSSSSGNTGSEQNKGDAAGDTVADTGTSVDSSTPPDDTGTVDDSTTTSPDSPGIDTTPPPNKCASVTCYGTYMKCCPSTGACYDTRYATCY